MRLQLHGSGRRIWYDANTTPGVDWFERRTGDGSSSEGGQIRKRGAGAGSEPTKRFPWHAFSESFSMVSSASEVLGVQDRRDQMVLSMAKDVARVKEKSREARHKKIRQVGYWSVKYKRFQGRRGEVLDEEVQAEERERRARSIRLMAPWLEDQADQRVGTSYQRVGTAH